MQTSKFISSGPLRFICPVKILFTPRDVYEPLWGPDAKDISYQLICPCSATC